MDLLQEWSFRDSKAAGVAARMLRADTARSGSPAERINQASHRHDLAGGVGVRAKQSKQLVAVSVYLHSYRQPPDPRLEDELVPAALYVIERELRALGGRQVAPDPVARGLSRDRLDALRAEGREVWVLSDVLHDIERVFDDPAQPGPWTARLEGVGPDHPVLDGSFALLDAAVSPLPGRLVNGLLRLGPTAGPSPLRTGDVVERLRD